MNTTIKGENCGYCQGGELLAKFGIKICELDVSQLILFKEQSKRGRCIVAYQDHVSEIVDISDEQRNRFFADVGAYGDTGCHLHMHLVPKYKDGDEWGGVFQMNPDKVYLTDAEYEEMIQQIKDALE